MPNVLGNYDPIFFASEALILLYKTLGMANRVFRGYDKTPQQLGSTINLKKPATFTAQDAPGASTDLNTESFTITLDHWKEVRFSLTDKELSYTGQQIIRDHITPAVYALADQIDQDLAGLYKFVPWYHSGATAVADITATRQILFNNKVPLNDLHLMIDGGSEAAFLALQAFSQYQGAGLEGVQTQIRGQLGEKYGFDIFANQNTPTHTHGTASSTALTMTNTKAQFSTSVDLSGTVTGTIVAGDVLQIAGDSQNYAVTGGPYTAAGNAFTGVGIFPTLRAQATSTTAVTLVQNNGVRNLAFHRNAFALAMAPLPDFYDGQGVRVFTATDPFTNLAIRARTWADGTNSAYRIALDVLYGVKALDANLAAAMLG